MNKNPVNYPYFKFPFALLNSPRFSHISSDAKLLFAIILDRFALSRTNTDRFTDEEGNVYIILTVEEACRKLRYGKTKVMRCFKELESAGLISRSRKIRCCPYRIYVSEAFFEVGNEDFPKYQNETSRSSETKPPEVSESDCNQNNNINININNINHSIIGFERTEEEIREQIEYDCFVCESNQKMIDEIVMIIYDVLNGTSPTVRVGKEEMPRGVVVSRFCKLNSEHIFNIMTNIKSNTAKIKNMKSYLITMLYNEPAISECSTQAEFSYYLH